MARHRGSPRLLLLQQGWLWEPRGLWKAWGRGWGLRADEPGLLSPSSHQVLRGDAAGNSGSRYHSGDVPAPGLTPRGGASSG